MLTLVGVLVFILAMLISIALHELGHMVPAKKFGTKVTSFMVGFGPTIFSFKKGETEYGLKAIPLGGYVKILGMLPPNTETQKGKRGTAQPDVNFPTKKLNVVGEENRQEHVSVVADAQPTSVGKKRVNREKGGEGNFFTKMASEARDNANAELETPEDKQRAFYKLPPWKKIVVMFSGPAMNLIIAVVLFFTAFAFLGMPAPNTEVKELTPCVPTYRTSTQCATDGETPAKIGGVEKGDVVTAVNGVPVKSWDDVVNGLQNSPPSEPAIIAVNRVSSSGEVVTVNLEVPLVRVAENTNPTSGTVAYLGVAPEIALQRVPAVEVPKQIGDIFTKSVAALLRFPEKFADIVGVAVKGEQRDPEGLVGVVGVSRISGEVVAAEVPPSWKVLQLLLIIASVNLFLFLFNLIPLVPLDGGHIAGAMYESAKKKTFKLFKKPDPGYVDTAKLIPFAYTIAALFIGLSVLLVYVDLFKPITIS